MLHSIFVQEKANTTALAAMDDSPKEIEPYENDRLPTLTAVAGIVERIADSTNTTTVLSDFLDVQFFEITSEYWSSARKIVFPTTAGIFKLPVGLPIAQDSNLVFKMIDAGGGSNINSAAIAYLSYGQPANFQGVGFTSRVVTATTDLTADTLSSIGTITDLKSTSDYRLIGGCAIHEHAATAGPNKGGILAAKVTAPSFNGRAVWLPRAHASGFGVNPSDYILPEPSDIIHGNETVTVEGLGQGSESPAAILWFLEVSSPGEQTATKPTIAPSGGASGGVGVAAGQQFVSPAAPASILQGMFGQR